MKMIIVSKPKCCSVPGMIDRLGLFSPAKVWTKCSVTTIIVHLSVLPHFILLIYIAYFTLNAFLSL